MKLRTLSVLVLLPLAPFRVWAAPVYRVETLAGSVFNSGTSVDGTGTAATFWYPRFAAIDSSGNIFVADSSADNIRMVTPAGVVTTIAGLTGIIGSTDATGSAARFKSPWGVAVDAAGNLFVADTNNYTIRKIAPGGVVTTIAGLAGTKGSTNGTGAAARFMQPYGIVVDPSGNLFVADTGANTIRKITAGGVVSTLAGTAGTQGSTDGTGPAARFTQPTGLGIDAAGNLYVSDHDNYTIRKVTPAGVVTTLAGLAQNPGDTDGVGSAARLNSVYGITVDGNGNVYACEYNQSTIRKISPAGAVTTIAGRAGLGSSQDGDGGAAFFSSPAGIAADVRGNLYIVDATAVVVRKARPMRQGDFDGDSRAELLWRNSGTAQVNSWTRAGGFLGFGAESDGWAVIGVGDFDGDDRNEPLWRNSISGQVGAWTAAGGFVGFGTESGGWSVIGVGDFDGDGKSELMWRNSNTTQVNTWTVAGKFLGFGAEGGGWSVIGVGDFDGDTKAEPLWHNTSNGLVAAWTSSGGFTIFGTEGGGWSVIGSGDFDGDGRVDVLWHNTSTGSVASWTSAGGFTVFGVEDANWTAIGTGDYDGDGRSDVLWRNSATGAVASWTSSGGFTVFGTEGGGWSIIP